MICTAIASGFATTPLLALAMIECADVIFAGDSVPTILAAGVGYSLWKTRRSALSES